ncbi:hypothetical protein [Polaromonas aquatica]|uniref:hypothetical protein n=1 Tax=Polaromonas aquatica TaxID=332657 RepID=UPI003D64E4A4
MTDEQCPKCGSKFPANGAWASRTMTGLMIAPALQDLDTRVKCPGCGKVFHATAFRFFGFVTPRAMRRGLGMFFVVFIGCVIYFLFVDAP